MEKEIEIPFGAKDSELKGWEYTIPENMEAEIKDGKIIVKSKESEDERINRAIFKALSKKEARDVLRDEHIQVSDALAYLERQKAIVMHTPRYAPPERINIKEMVAKYSATDEYIEGEYKGKPVNCMIRAYKQGIRDTLLKVKEQKPALDDYLKATPTERRKMSMTEILEKEHRPTQFKGESLVDIIKGEFEGFRSLLKKKGIDYEPQSTYWEGFARLFDSSARKYLREHQPKQEWSEEDEMMQSYLINYFLAGIDESKLPFTAERAIEWLNTLPKRSCLQPKQEWSEEDNMLMDELESYILYDKEFNDEQKSWRIKRLKSMRPAWKPNDDQIQVIYNILKSKWGGVTDRACLLGLVNDLKKL